MTAPYWVDIIGTIVGRVQADSSKPAALASDEPFYMYGHPLEVVNTLIEKDLHSTEKFNKYPLIALFQDFREQNNPAMNIKSSVSLNLIIATQTNPDYKSADRMTYTFKPILYPLYNLFLEKVISSGLFQVSGSYIPHDKYDRMRWGKTGLYASEGEIGADHIDAIEIQNLRLDLYYTSRTCNT